MAKDKPVYAFIRKGNALIPEMEIDLAALEGIAQGQRVIADIKHGRNIKRLRAYWVMLQACVDATGCAPSKESLDAYIRPAVGFVDTVRQVNNKITFVPRHINFSKCEEPEMIAFFKSAEECLAADFGFVMPERERDAA